MRKTIERDCPECGGTGKEFVPYCKERIRCSHCKGTGKRRIKMDQLLSNDERSTILGMSVYWREVTRREDTSPLQGELAQIIRLLGTKIYG